MQNFSYKCEVKGGTLRVRPLEGKDIVPGTALLVAAFADALEKRPPVLVKKLLLMSLEEIPDGICLVADLETADGVREQAGIVSLSIGQGSADKSLEPAPPHDATYLSNMAVDPELRRQGVATALLTACDILVKEIGGADIWLHVFEADERARALYLSFGYTEQAAASKSGTGLLGGFFAGRKVASKALMKKRL